MRTLCLSVVTAAAICSLSAPAFGRGGTHPEVQVAQDAAGRIVAGLPFEMPVELPDSIFPGFPGWADSVPGFASVFVADPDNGVFLPNPDSQLEFLVTDIDTGLGLLNDHGSAFMSVGETFFLGQPDFDTHPLWNIPAATHGQVFSITIVLRDRAHLMSDSEPITLTLTPAPCAGDFNNDGAINTSDLVELLVHFGQSIEHGEPGHETDMNHDGVVNTADLTQFLARFGLVC